MTKCERIASEAEYAVCVFTNADGTVFALLDFPVPEKREATQEEMAFAGVLGVVGGLPCCAMEIDIADAAMARLGSQFAARFTVVAETRSLERLYSLPDPRDAG